MYAGDSLISSATILDRRERRLYHHPPIDATLRITQIGTPTRMPALEPMLRPRLGADFRVFVGEVVGEDEVEEDEVVVVEEAEGVMLK
jgi:hypothetical protein